MRIHTVVLGVSALALPLLLSGAYHEADAAQSNELCEELQFLRGFLGEWTGHFDNADEPLVVHETWTAILNGQAIRKTRSVPAAEQFAVEAMYFYDRTTATVRFVLVTNNGYVNRGTIALDGDVFRQTGNQVGPDSSARSTVGIYRFMGEDTLVEEGGHTIIFERG